MMDLNKRDGDAIEEALGAELSASVRWQAAAAMDGRAVDPARLWAELYLAPALRPPALLA